MKANLRTARPRLDVALVEQGLAESREKAHALIMAGHVLVDDVPAVKPSQLLSPDSTVRLKEELPYVSRGGLKLAAALDAFAIDPTGLIAADVGASTGGFTDCLLQRGAAQVFAIDVGYGQLAWKLRQDQRVVLLERTNARLLAGLPGDVLADLAVVDVSFIGLDLVLPAIARFLQPHGRVIALVKPQFEAGKGKVGKGGVVRDPALHRAVLQRVLEWAIAHGWQADGLIRSPITGPKGNVEFLLALHRGLAAEDPPPLTTWIESVCAAP
ncbi:MAG: TlyA family RNA methyltransferase [Caldilineales bacterium]